MADEEEHRKENKVEMNFFSIVSTLTYFLFFIFSIVHSRET